MANRPAAPASATQIGGSIEARLSAIQDALNRKADQTTEPVYRAVQLIAPSGAVWRLRVADDGTLTTEQVLRS